MTAEPPENAHIPICDESGGSLLPAILAQYSRALRFALVFLKEQAMKHAISFLESVFSFAVFAAITLAIAGTTYQAVNPGGGLTNWIFRVWEVNPTLVIMLGGITLLVKRWLSGLQGDQAADLMFYAAVMLGLYYGFNLLIAA
jgi:hypothetical protein